jgi:hypothetical protein
MLFEFNLNPTGKTFLRALYVSVVYICLLCLSALTGGFTIFCIQENEQEHHVYLHVVCLSDIVNAFVYYAFRSKRPSFIENHTTVLILRVLITLTSCIMVDVHYLLYQSDDRQTLSCGCGCG